MTPRWTRFAVALSVAAIGVAGPAAQTARPAGGPVSITSDDLLAGLSDPGKWLLYGGNYQGQRYSPLTRGPSLAANVSADTAHTSASSRSGLLPEARPRRQVPG